MTGPGRWIVGLLGAALAIALTWLVSERAARRAAEDELVDARAIAGAAQASAERERALVLEQRQIADDRTAALLDIEERARADHELAAAERQQIADELTGALAALEARARSDHTRIDREVLDLTREIDRSGSAAAALNREFGAEP